MKFDVAKKNTTWIVVDLWKSFLATNDVHHHMSFNDKIKYKYLIIYVYIQLYYILDCRLYLQYDLAMTPYYVTACEFNRRFSKENYR